MKTLIRGALGVAIIVLALTMSLSAQRRTAIESRFAVVNGRELDHPLMIKLSREQNSD